MPFIASVSKPASSYFNCGVGQFVSPDTTHAVLCGINKITLVSCGAGKETTDASIVKEFALAATLKYAETVAVYDPITKQLLRHILFLCSIRQEVSLVCFALHPETGEMVMVPLYHHNIDHSRYQVHPGEVHLCSTTNHSRSSTPFIAFCISCGEVYMLDVLAAIYPTEGDAECGGDRNWAWDYPPLKALSAQRQGAVYSRTTFDATEYDVRDFAFGLPSSPDGSTDLPFYVLYADAHSKSHVSSYAFSTKESSHQLLNPKPFLFLDDTCAWSENRLTQRTLLQENVEGSAAKLAVSPAGVFVVGGHLISLVTSSSHRKKKTITHELPFTHGVARETICVCFTKPNDLLTCYTDGTVVQISVKEIKTPVVSVKMELRTTRLPTLPSAVAVVKPSLLILASRFDDNCIYNMKSETATSLGTHFGPVVDMCTMSRNSITSVVASTGIGRRGGLMLVSSAASVVERCSVSLPHGASQLFAAGHLIITQLCGTCRLFLTQWSDRPSFREVKVKDVPALMAPRVKLIGLHQHSGDLYMVAHNRGVEVVEARGDGVVYKETIHIQMEGQILHAAFVGDCAVFSDENNHIFAVRDGRPLRTAQVDGCISCLEFLTSASYAYGTWNNILCVVDFATGTCLRRLMLESVPTSVCSITSSFSHIETVFIGTLDGFLIDTPLDGMLSSGLTDRGMKLMHTPVELRVLGDIVLAMGDAPLIIMPSQHGFQVTGLSLCGVVACGQLNPHLFAFLSQRENSIVLGSLDKVQKVSSRFTNLGFTVTHVRYISCWGGVVASLRRSQQDEIAFFSANSLETPWKVLTGSKERSSRHLLLENERCVFIEPLDLGGVNRSDPGERVPELGSLTNFVVLIGSSFVFPDEQKSRSSRIAWYSLDDTTQQMQLISSDDTSGAIQCCCPVPNFPGRVAVGICGCVVIYNWNAVDAKFVREERYRIGVTVTKLIPLFSPDVHRSSVVALDARHSAFFLSVDQLQGGISVMARESSLRSVMDGVLLSDTDLCMCDDRFNFLCLRMEECPPIAHPEGAHAAANDVPRHRLNTIAQCNMGDLVTSMQRGSFSQGALTSDSVPSVKSLLGGLTGPQVVYGTAHGSFGMITPIANATYLCLRAIELAVLDHVQPNGWFFDQVHRSVFTSGQHDFRHIIPSPGSTESADRAHRTPAGRNRSGHHHDSSAPLDVFFGTYGSASSRLIPQPHQMGEDQSKTTSQNVCDGEVVGRYLNLSGPVRAGILAAAQRYTEIALGSFDSAGALKTFNGAVDFRFSGRPSKASLGTIAHKFNTLFASEGLPTLPYTDEAIRNLLLRVQRIQ